MSAAAELSHFCSVLVLEAESQPGYHSTGRSAAYFSPAYGNATVRGLSAASESFYRQPPSGFSDATLLRLRDALHVAPHGNRERFAAAAAQTSTLKPASVQMALARVPLLDPSYVDCALLESGGGDLNVDAILQGFRRRLQANGGSLVTSARISRIKRTISGFALGTADQQWSADIVVNAAGAWADEIAILAGIAPIGLTPKRRTAMLIPAPAEMDCSEWPLVINEVDQLYFKPDAGALLISPMDETPSVPCDAAPEDIDVANAVARFEASTNALVSRVTHRWSGLRTFATDETFVVGFEPGDDNFFWLAGQGGYGVQTAPALSRLAAGIIAQRLSKLVATHSPEWEFVGAVDPGRLR